MYIVHSSSRSSSSGSGSSAYYVLVMAVDQCHAADLFFFSLFFLPCVVSVCFG